VSLPCGLAAAFWLVQPIQHHTYSAQGKTVAKAPANAIGTM
jgi:hypothetical protein